MVMPNLSTCLMALACYLAIPSAWATYVQMKSEEACVSRTESVEFVCTSDILTGEFLWNRKKEPTPELIASNSDLFSSEYQVDYSASGSERKSTLTVDDQVTDRDGAIYYCDVDGEPSTSVTLVEKDDACIGTWCTDFSICDQITIDGEKVVACSSGCEIEIPETELNFALDLPNSQQFRLNVTVTENDVVLGGSLELPWNCTVSMDSPLNFDIALSGNGDLIIEVVIDHPSHSGTYYPMTECKIAGTEQTTTPAPDATPVPGTEKTPTPDATPAPGTEKTTTSAPDTTPSDTVTVDNGTNSGGNSGLAPEYIVLIILGSCAVPTACILLIVFVCKKYRNHKPARAVDPPVETQRSRNSASIPPYPSSPYSRPPAIYLHPQAVTLTTGPRSSARYETQRRPAGQQGEGHVHTAQAKLYDQTPPIRRHELSTYEPTRRRGSRPRPARLQKQSSSTSDPPSQPSQNSTPTSHPSLSSYPSFHSYPSNRSYPSSFGYPHSQFSMSTLPSMGYNSNPHVSLYSSRVAYHSAKPAMFLARAENKNAQFGLKF